MIGHKGRCVVARFRVHLQSIRLDVDTADALIEIAIGILPEQPDPLYGRDMPHHLQFPLCEGKYRFKWGLHHRGLDQA